MLVSVFAYELNYGLSSGANKQAANDLFVRYLQTIWMGLGHVDRWLAMKVYRRVVEAGGFTRAADSLTMPKASVSTLVQDLEAHLGVRLLNRTTRQVTVTADGAAYYEQCVRLLNDLEEVENSLGNAKAEPRGRLRVDVPGSLGRRIIMPALSDFTRRYPDIQLELGCSDRRVDMLEEGVDCVLRGGKLEDSSFVARHIGLIHFALVATPNYLRRHGEPKTPEDLRSHKVINYFSARSGKMLPWDFMIDGKRVEYDLPGNVSTNDADAYFAAGMAGLGVMQVPTFMVRSAVEAGELNLVMADCLSDTLPLNLLYPQSRHLSTKVRVWVDWVAELLRESALFRTSLADLSRLQAAREKR
jgi:LysR family transcriptional regulator, regulator for bpeEF and oprC